MVAYGASASYDTAPRLLEALARDQPGIAIETEVRAAREIVAGVQEARWTSGSCAARPTRRAWSAGPCAPTARACSCGTTTGSPPLTRSGSPTCRRNRSYCTQEANPGHYDAVLGLCREQDVEPRVVLRSLVFDLSQAPVVNGDAVAIVGESSCSGLPAELAWRPLTPARSLGIDLVARRHDRSPAVGRLLDAADRISGELGWV